MLAQHFLEVVQLAGSAPDLRVEQEGTCPRQCPRVVARYSSAAALEMTGTTLLGTYITDNSALQGSKRPQDAQAGPEDA